MRVDVGGERSISTNCDLVSVKNGELNILPLPCLTIDLARSRLFRSRTLRDKQQDCPDTTLIPGAEMNAFFIRAQSSFCRLLPSHEHGRKQPGEKRFTPCSLMRRPPALFGRRAAVACLERSRTALRR